MPRCVGGTGKGRTAKGQGKGGRCPCGKHAAGSPACPHLSAHSPARGAEAGPRPGGR